MTSSITTRLVRDGAGNLFPRQLYDVSGGSGPGNGPYIALQMLANATGTGALDLAALNAALVDAIGDAATVLPTGAASDAVLAAILAKLSGDPATQTTLAAILAKLSDDPATGAGLAAILAKQDVLAVTIGEVQAVPTANTVLDRLKAIATGLGGVVLDAGTAVIGKVGLQVGGADVAALNPVPVTASALPLPAGAATATGVQAVATAVAYGTAQVHADLGTLASAAQIGEVQAAPTANTVLDRLTAIATGLGAVVLGAGTAVIGKVGLQVGGADVAAGNALPARITGTAYQPSGVAPVAGSLAAAGASAAITPIAGRQAYLTLSGGTSLTGAVQWSLDGGTSWAAITVEGMPLGMIAYAGTPIAVPLPICQQAGVLMRLMASAIVGTVAYQLSQ